MYSTLFSSVIDLFSEAVSGSKIFFRIMDQAVNKILNPCGYSSATLRFCIAGDQGETISRPLALKERVVFFI
jgi:hypothetical protein